MGRCSVLKEGVASIEATPKIACDLASRATTCLLGRLFVFALLQSFQTLFTALGAIRGALHEFGADQFEHRLLRSIPFAPAKAHDARVAAGALAETGTEFIEKLLHRRRRLQK